MTLNNSGIDLDSGHSCSKMAFSWAKKSFKNRSGFPGEVALEIDGAFCNIMKFGETLIGMTSDGIGTKAEIAERTGDHSTLGYDLIAMVADDLIANGVVPANITNILDVDVLDHAIVESLMKGLYEAANFSKVSVTGGEIAELGARISGWGSSMHFNWCATAIGYVPKGRKPISASNAKEGDVVIAFKSRGFRSNGFSMARKILSGAFGENWHSENFSKNVTWGKALLTPSLIYSPCITKILESDIRVSGIAHITGGGVPDNLGRILKYKALGAELDNLFEPHDFMKKTQELGNVSDEKAYRLWNMGTGMLIVAPADSSGEILKIAEICGYIAQVCGRVTSVPGVRIKSKAISSDDLLYTRSGK
ncbi:MAG: phosphoribosylformylglycinamidine cyclo-ligase [Candidatus Riflebacteria bacterium]|nr:phosphoribosylformylglycinamidine cyclo-ligase [Candidatus Riflebacteria bacterium]